MVRVAVLVSGGGTNLQKVLEAQQRGELAPGRVCLVISNRKAAFALERAKNACVPTRVLSKAMEPDPDLWDEKLLSILKENKIDMIALCGFLMQLGPRVVRAYENRIINIHPALIPAFCGHGFYGLKVHEAALARGVKLSGATAHLANENYDEGPILLQIAVPVEKGDTPETLQKRVMEQGEYIIMPKAIQMVAQAIEEGVDICDL